MRVSLSKTYKLSLGNYESVEVGAHVTLDSIEDYDDDELPDSRDEAITTMQADATKYLDQYLEPELRAVADMSQADASVLIEPAPRRERATRRRSKH